MSLFGTYLNQAPPDDLGGILYDVHYELNHQILCRIRILDNVLSVLYINKELPAYQLVQALNYWTDKKVGIAQ